jgi:hypothetical protein
MLIEPLLKMEGDEAMVYIKTFLSDTNIDEATLLSHPLVQTVQGGEWL